MFVSERIAFIELQKTGCTHIGRLLSKLLEGEFERKHNTATPDLFTPDRKFLGSVRNPWDWYVSLWGYGCDKKGAVQGMVTKPRNRFRKLGWNGSAMRAARTLLLGDRRQPEKWREAYADVNDPECFRKWLRMVHDPKHWNDYGEGYGVAPVSRVAGFLTYRYAVLFCKDAHSAAFRGARTFADLQSFTEANDYIDHFIRNERLEDDLVKALENCGITLSDDQRNIVYGSAKTNTSSRKVNPGFYHDRNSIALIADREKLIIDNFGYTPPSL